MTSIRNIVKISQQLLSDNSPAILTGIGVAGTITTAVLAHRAALRANEIVEKEQIRLDLFDKSHPLEPREKAELVWMEYIPPVMAGVVTVGAIIFANRIGTRRTAAIAAAYSISERARVEYAEKVVEHIGKNKERKVRDEIAQDRLNSSPASRQDIYATGGGGDLMFEQFTGRYFYSTIENVKHAQNRVNHEIVNGVYASLSDFYDYLGLPHTGVSDELGWNGDHLMEITFSTGAADNGSPCHIFNYHVEPVRNYFRVH